MNIQSQKSIIDILLTAKILFLKIQEENELGYFDNNRAIQSFFVKFFSIVYGYDDLVELDKKHKISNYPAIDLGSLKNRIAFQVTSQTGSGKIQESIDKFIEYNLHQQYDRLVFVIIANQSLRKTAFNTDSKFIFNIESDVWDIKVLMDTIRYLDEEDKIEKIYNLFLKELPDIVSFGHTINENEIKESIEFISQVLGITGNEPISAQDIPNRSSPEFMTDKNQLNGINDEIFLNCIRPDILYSQSLINFLKDPVNGKLLMKYWICCKKISEDSTTSILKEFEKLSGSVPRYSKDVGISGDTLAIVLHNMYYCCDVGTNP